MIYIGDGRSPANLLGTEQFAKVGARLADARIPVISYVVGPRVDRPLLGRAGRRQTGGALMRPP